MTFVQNCEALQHRRERLELPLLQRLALWGDCDRGIPRLPVRFGSERKGSVEAC